MLNPGRLKTRLVLEAPVETPDGQGGVARSYAIAATLWASVAAGSSRDDVRADAAGAGVTHRIGGRSNVEIKGRHPLREGVRV